MRSLFTFRHLFVLLAAVVPALAQDYPPISPADRALSKDPSGKGGHAVLLYREDTTDDVLGVGKFFRRIKILDEEGRKHADVEIPFIRELGSVGGIKARTIRPDGSVAEFNGQVFEKTLFKGRRIKFLAKTFTMPEIAPGSIIEYQWSTRRDPLWLRPPHWYLQEDLYTVKAKFAHKPNLQYYGLMWYVYGIPATLGPKEKNRFYTMELENIPGFRDEKLSPPDRAMKARIDFFYTELDVSEYKDPAKFWQKQARKRLGKIDEFIGKPKTFQKDVAEITAGAKDDEEKLQRLYAKVQQLRNLSFERSKSEKEEKREKRKELLHAKDVWQEGYGTREELNFLFVGLARAAGLEASFVEVTERDADLFNPNFTSFSQFDGNAVEVVVNGKPRYFDPGTLYCPFGLLPWRKTGVGGIRYAKEGDVLITMPLPERPTAVIKRDLTLDMADDGALQGSLAFSLSGDEALVLRQAHAGSDETARKKAIEDMVQSWLPSVAKVTVAEAGPWETSDPEFKAKVTLSLPNIAASMGRRMLFPLLLVQSRLWSDFEDSKREYPVFLDYKTKEEDTLKIRLPKRLKADSLPPAKQVKTDFAEYQVTYAANGGTIELRRTYEMLGVVFQLKLYPELQQFFKKLRAADEQQAVLTANTAAAEVR